MGNHDTQKSHTRDHCLKYFFILLKVEYFLIQHILIMVSPSSSPPNCSPLSLPSRDTPFQSLIRKEKASKKEITMKHDKEKHNKMKQKYIKVEHCIPK